MKKNNIGIVGLGDISFKHRKAINKISHFNLIATCDPKKKISNNKNYRSIDEMLKFEKDLNTVAIMTPSSQHFKQVLKCLNNKKDVIVEKPICMNLKQLKKIMHYEKKFKKKVFIVHQNRLNSNINFVKKKIDKKELGQIIFFTSALYWNRNKSYYLKSNWRGTHNHDGGVVMNQGIHNIDIISRYFGEVKTIYYEKKKIKKYLEREDTGIITFKFKNGIIGNFLLSTAVNKESYSNSLKIFGSNYNINLFGRNMEILKYKGKIYKFNKINFLHNEFYKSVNKTLLKKKKNFFSTKSIFETIKIVEAINKCIKAKKKITL